MNGGFGLDHDPSELREAARDLLTRPPYREEEGLVSRLWDTVREWVAEVVGRVLGLVSGDATMGWLVVAVGLLLLLVVVWRVIRGLTVDRTSEAPRLETGGGYTSGQWARYAEEQARLGDLDGAVRARYLQLVTRLAEQGAVEDVPSRTVGELDRELATTAPTLAPAVARAGAVFGEVFYGRRPAEADQLERLTDLVAEVERSLRPGVLAAVGSRDGWSGP